MRWLRIPATLLVLAWSVPLSAQQSPPMGMQHMPGMQHDAAQPGQGGQAAFAAIAEVVKLLEADTTTDWSRVDLEALRQHLIDMDAVTMKARVRQSRVAGGLTMDITGDRAAAGSIRRMVGAHAPVLEELGGWRATTAPLAAGMRLTVVASDAKDSVTIARIRGLGFIGLMTEGAHHTEHHLMIARGAGAHAHGKP